MLFGDRKEENFQAEPPSNPHVPFGQCEHVQAAMHHEHESVEEGLAHKPAYEETGD